MSVMRLPSGRWRAQVYDPAIGRNVSVSRILGGSGTFTTKTEAKCARTRARERLGSVQARDVTVAGFWERWTADPLFARPKESTNIHNRERTRAFIELHGSRRIGEVDDEVVADWLAGGKRNGTVPALRAMFNDAASAKAGRLVRQNPFARLGISKGRGVVMSSHRARSRSGSWSAVRTSRRVRRLRRGCRSRRSPACGRGSWMLCAA